MSVCGPTVTLTASLAFGQGVWYYPSDVVSVIENSTSTTFTVDSSGFSIGKMKRMFYLEETNWHCKNRDTVLVTFHKRVRNINAGPDTVLYTFDRVFHLKNSSPEPWETSSWATLEGSGYVGGDVITGLSPGRNSFLWKIWNVIETCSLTDSLIVDVYNLEIPEGFSPNDDKDGFNNTFVIKGFDPANQDAELKIMNGSGTEVFSTSNINMNWIDWDGKNSQGVILPEGTYYYLLKITSKNEGSKTKVFKKSGFVILKRY
jgi:gliding motility-associated-like protein